MKKISIILTLIMLCGIVYAKTDALYHKMNTRYKRIARFEAEIEQINHFVEIDRTINYTGKLYFERGRLLLNYTSPTRQRLYIAQNQAELYDESSKTLFKSAVLPQFSQLNPVEILQEYWRKSEVRILSEGKATTKVELTPHKDTHFAKIVATLDESGLARELSTEDKSGNTLHYRFKGIRINRSIPEDIWRTSYPKDTKIIQQ